MRGEPNKEKLMVTRGGVIPKPRPRKRKGGGGSFPWPVEERKRTDRTTWFSCLRDLFGGR